ncbi:hypothetical protein HZH68_003996 [Vespula germanica]|uniref:Reverse transcriptase domain-containing protein n=1 Tax=Vespula germanica TaxID=30212 RepID=A0A834KMY2_VESGE|nr:hypothetical protein HZH68_003996 [Vespula germanica]
MIIKVPENRFGQVLQHVKLHSLNSEGKEVAKYMIKDSIDLFHLPGDGNIRATDYILGNKLFVYLDDIVIYSYFLDEHVTKFRKLSDRLRKADLKLQPDKCNILSKNPGKMKAVKKFPKTTKNIKQFLGLAGYYQQFISTFHP